MRLKPPLKKKNQYKSHSLGRYPKVPKARSGFAPEGVAKQLYSGQGESRDCVGGPALGLKATLYIKAKGFSFYQSEQVCGRNVREVLTITLNSAYVNIGYNLKQGVLGLFKSY